MSDPDRFDSAGFVDYLVNAAVFLIFTIAGLSLVYFFS